MQAPIRSHTGMVLRCSGCGWRTGQSTLRCRSPGRGEDCCSGGEGRTGGRRPSRGGSATSAGAGGPSRSGVVPGKGEPLNIQPRRRDPGLRTMPGATRRHPGRLSCRCRPGCRLLAGTTQGCNHTPVSRYGLSCTCVLAGADGSDGSLPAHRSPAAVPGLPQPPSAGSIPC